MLKVINVILGACIGAVISLVIAWLISTCVVWVMDFGAKYYPDVFNRDILNDSLVLDFYSKNDIWSWVRKAFN